MSWVTAPADFEYPAVPRAGPDDAGAGSLRAKPPLLDGPPRRIAVAIGPRHCWEQGEDMCLRWVRKNLIESSGSQEVFLLKVRTWRTPVRCCVPQRCSYLLTSLRQLRWHTFTCVVRRSRGGRASSNTSRRQMTKKRRRAGPDGCQASSGVRHRSADACRTRRWRSAAWTRPRSPAPARCPTG